MKYYSRTYHKQGNHLTATHKSMEDAESFVKREWDIWTEDNMKLIGAMISRDKDQLINTDKFKWIYGI